MKINSKAKSLAEKLLPQADVQINGPNPWDPQIHNENLYSRVLHRGTLGLGEAYMDGWWDCAALDEFITRVLRARLDKYIAYNKVNLFLLLMNYLFNFQTKRRAFEVGKKHYDLGNKLYELMLDKTMTYSCGYWKDAQNLDQAQLNKLDLICRKLYLKPGMTLLDIGCGWGGLAKYAAENYGVSVVGITISNEQQTLAVKRCEGLPIEIRLQDYRELHETFDRIVSVGMFEHVGRKNYDVYMQVAHRCLKDNGLFLLHTIGSNQSSVNADPWLTNYIFTNSMLPSIKQIANASEKLFIMEDWHNFSVDYDKTAMAWFANFDHYWPELKNQYDERFYRMWKYYLLSCAGTFRSRSTQLWQVVFSKYGIVNGYLSIR